MPQDKQSKKPQPAKAQAKKQDSKKAAPAPSKKK